MLKKKTYKGGGVTGTPGPPLATPLGNDLSLFGFTPGAVNVSPNVSPVHNKPERHKTLRSGKILYRIKFVE